MYQLSDLALEVILKEWHPQEYGPLQTDVREWIHSIESFCAMYGIPDVQRPRCALDFIKEELRHELVKVLAEARARFGPVHWDRFKDFMVALDHGFQEQWERLPFYKKYPKLTGTAVGITSGILLAPIAVVGVLLAPVTVPGALSLVGFTSAGVAAGSLAAAIQSIVYGGATGGLFSLLQSAGATTVLSSIGTIFTGAAATGVGVAGAAAAGVGAAIVTDNQLGTSTSELLRTAADSVPPNDNPNDDGDANPPPYHTIPQEYLLTPKAISAIVKSWDVGTYNPPGTNCSSWLRRIHNLSERYGVPISQQALCAMHCMGTNCREAAHAAECYDMTWDRYTAWLHRYDHEYRRNANRRTAELLAN